MSSATDPFFGNRPEHIWDEGFEAAMAGRSRDTNPFRTGEAEELDRIGKESAALGSEEGSTPGSSFTRVSGEELQEILRRHQEEGKP
ncbi:MAG TPA: hypothetical protein VFJ94_07015 [Intrasporangium sp.]|uniref:hypothetical protein n=1 Tax=Intrasporangium sp. TaxID=1925024 RepID=UPI002D78F9D9|nr:hypothetical protein [Intrasporangium sp.]HET7398256.1 hypothetical protein [Intrasporangium sp.]